MILGKPPIWEEANKAFQLREGVVFTYGDTLYNPEAIQIPRDLMIHEETHAKQQEYNETVAKIWWMKYIEDPEFRLSQELEAYRAQYKYICSIIKDRNARDRNLRTIAKILASPMYGSIISESEALKKLR